MALKYRKPRSSGRRTIISIDYKKVLTTNKPTRSLISSIHNKAGRNVHGMITVRHKGGRHKRMYREIDFKRDIIDKVGTIKTIEYDPNRTALISLVTYETGQRRYIITPRDSKVGDQIISSETTDVKIGNCMKISNMPEGTFVHCVELTPNTGAKMVRTAGSYAQILGKDETGEFTIIKLPCGENRKIPNACRAVIGMIANEDHNIINFGKAGTSRHMGIKPTVRGSAMNPIDHPHGGGEGRQGIGHPAALTPWGKRCMGVKTRKSKQYSTKLIIKRRNGK
jgi:large subunit ribosomal protein L2